MHHRHIRASVLIAETSELIDTTVFNNSAPGAYQVLVLLCAQAVMQ